MCPGMTQFVLVRSSGYRLRLCQDGVLARVTDLDGLGVWPPGICRSTRSLGTGRTGMLHPCPSFLARQLEIPTTWAWADAIATVRSGILALPHPPCPPARHPCDHGRKALESVEPGQPALQSGSCHPGQGAFDDPPAGRDLEGVGVALADDLYRDLEAGGGPGGELACVVGISPRERMWVQVRARFHSSGFAASRPWTQAAVTTTARTSPVVSTAMWRLRPLT